MMTVPTLRRAGRLPALLLAIASLGVAPDAPALDLDDEGALRLAMRAYTALRIGTEEIGGDDNPFYFPGSAAGHVRQHRYFLQLDLEHDLRAYSQSGFGLARALDWADLDVFKYSITYRGEGEGIYDYGPSEYSEFGNELREFRRDVPPEAAVLSPGTTQRLPPEFIDRRISRLRRLGRQRHRLFYAYVDTEKGPAFLRIGRQVLAWGETDVFRLLDNINPLDDSFGGFFIALDERRLPLDMIRGSWNFGSIWKFDDTFLEGFVAQGNRVAQDPGIPDGSPWRPGAMAYPNPVLKTVIEVPDFLDVRGGARVVSTIGNVTASLAHYYTYFDVPGGRFVIPGSPAGGGANTPTYQNPILGIGEHPRVSVTGASATFPLEKLYSIMRTEVAFFKGEPMNRQGKGDARDNVGDAARDGSSARLRRWNNLEGGLNPFVWPNFLNLARTTPIHGRTLRLDTFNVSVGLDMNRYIRWLNPQQTFFFTTQLFYKHVFDSPGDLILPVVYKNVGVNPNAPVVGVGPGDAPLGCLRADGTRRNCRLQPKFLSLDDDRFLHTLLITTSYRGGRIVPQFGFFYDWQGAAVFQPGVTLVRDPFRFGFDYTAVVGSHTGQFGAVRDRDNVRFQVEYVF
jgi:hypothetical protein